MEQQRFHFQALNQKESQKINVNKTSHILWLCHGASEDYETSMVQAYGRLLTLFGKPLYRTRNVESEYEYIIKAQDDKGTVLYLTAYSGPSGPSIGGRHKDLDLMAAGELAALIKNAPPSDYDYTGYYMDGPCMIKKGIKNGTVYYEETELEPSAENFQMMENALDELLED